MMCSTRQLLGRLWPNYKTKIRLCTSGSNARRVLEHQSSYFLMMSNLYKILQKFKLQYNIFLRLCIFVWNCEHSEYINNSCFWQNQTIPDIYICQCCLCYHRLCLFYYFSGKCLMHRTVPLECLGERYC